MRRLPAPPETRFSRYYAFYATQLTGRGGDRMR